jgi:hypothetical protein
LVQTELPLLIAHFTEVLQVFISFGLNQKYSLLFGGLIKGDKNHAVKF